MYAIESMIIGRREPLVETDALEASAPLFMWLSDSEYCAAVSSDAWAPIKKAVRTLTVNTVERSVWKGALEPLSLEDYAIVRNELFVSGMPFAAVPVESLYKQWSSEQGNLFGGTRGLYLGDPAKHMSAIYNKLDIVVPARFAAMPDHVTLELELLTLLLRAGNTNAATEVVAEHLDWLNAYASALDERMRAVMNRQDSDQERSHSLTRGIAFVRTLTQLVDRAAQRAVGRKRPI